MKSNRIISSLLCVSMLLGFLLSFSSCSAPKECSYSTFKAALDEEEQVTVCLYGKDESNEYFDVEVNEDFTSLLNGEFTPFEKDSQWDKLLTVTVSMQYELCLFEDGTAMIYYGFAGVTQKDREYYNYKLNSGTDALINYIRGNGTTKNMEEESK